MNANSTSRVSRRSFNRMVGGAMLATPFLNSTSVGAPSDTIRIGFVSPNTGPMAEFGAPDKFLLKTMEAHLAGGVDVGGKTMKLEILHIDTRSNVAVASKATKALIEKEAPDLILTHSAPETVNPVADAAEAMSTPCLSTVSPWEAFYFGRGAKPGEESPFKWTYHFSFGTGNFLKQYNDQWSRIETNRKVGALLPGDPDGNAMRGILLPALAEQGWEIVDPGPYANMSSDFTAHIQAFKAAGVDIVYTLPFPPDFPVFWRQAAMQGLAPQLKLIQLSKAGLFPSELEAIGQLGYGINSGMYWHPKFPYASSSMGMSNEELATKWEAGTGKQWSQPVGATASLFDAGIALIAQAGDPKDREAMAEAMPKLKAETAVGPIDFTTGPVKNVTETHLAGGQWNKASEGPFAFTYDIVSNADCPDVPLTSELAPFKIGG